jgi:radical SAM-linked protein
MGESAAATARRPRGESGVMVGAFHSKPDAPGPGPASRERWLLTYAVDGDLRYLSHHDTLRLFVRAITRAALPARYTRGFNPRPKVSNPLPLPVGVASDAETLIVEFTEPMVRDGLLARLARQLPAGLMLLGARRLGPRESFNKAIVTYQLELSETLLADVGSLLDRILESQALPIERIDARTGSRRVVDVRPYLVELHRESSFVRFTLRVTEAGTAKPAEIAGLLGVDPASANHRIRRVNVQWE